MDQLLFQGVGARLLRGGSLERRLLRLAGTSQLGFELLQRVLPLLGGQRRPCFPGGYLKLRVTERAAGFLQTLLQGFEQLLLLASFELARFQVFTGAVHLTVRALLDAAHVGLLGQAIVLGLLLLIAQGLLQGRNIGLQLASRALQFDTLLLQVFDLHLTLRQQLVQVGQPGCGVFPGRFSLAHLPPGQCDIAAGLFFHPRNPLVFGRQYFALGRDRMFDHPLGEHACLLPDGHECLRHLGRQPRQAGLAPQPLRQLLPPLIEQGAYSRRATPAQLEAHALYSRPLAAGQHGVRCGKYVGFRYAHCHATHSTGLGMIIQDYPTLNNEFLKYNTLNVMKNTFDVALIETQPLDLHFLAENTAHAAQAFIAAGTAANTVRSYRSALGYWSAWLKLRYGQVLGDAPLPAAVAIQFVLDHLARPVEDGSWSHLLPIAIDHALVDGRAKSRLGPLAYSTVQHRLAVLGKWHRVKGWDSPTDMPALKTLLRSAQKAQVRQGVTVRKKTAMALEPLQAMLATCTDGVRGIRDRALLLLAWSGGGRRRSEVVALQVGDVRRLDVDTWVYSLGATKTDTAGARREKPLRGPAAHALAAWLAAAPATTGPLFRRLYRGDKVASQGLGGDQVARIVKRRAQLAGLEGDWAAHSLRSGFVTEAGRQGVPLGDVMAMTEHRSVATVMGYFQAGSLLGSKAADLIKGDD